MFFCRVHRVLVLDKSRVAEFDTPSTLLQRQESLFYSLAKTAGLAQWVLTALHDLMLSANREESDAIVLLTWMLLEDFMSLNYRLCLFYITSLCITV